MILETPESFWRKRVSMLTKSFRLFRSAVDRISKNFIDIIFRTLWQFYLVSYPCPTQSEKIKDKYNVVRQIKK